MVSKSTRISRGAAVVAGLALIVAGTVLTAPPAFAVTTATLSNNDISMTIDWTSGLKISNLTDQSTSHVWISSAIPVFKTSVNLGTEYTSAQLTAGAATVTANSVVVPLTQSGVSWEVTFTIDQPGGMIHMYTTLHNTTGSTEFFRVQLPSIAGFTGPGSSADLMGAVPFEMGGIANLATMDALPGDHWLGLSPRPDQGLPTAFNQQNYADVWDGAGGGGFFMMDESGNVAQGATPVQFQLNEDELKASWVQTVKPNLYSSPSTIAIGMHHSGDWRAASTQYEAFHSASSTFASVPTWLREAGAVYAPSAGGAGGMFVYQQPEQPLGCFTTAPNASPQVLCGSAGEGQITSFLDLPDLLTEAQRLGSNVVMLDDYWSQETHRSPHYRTYLNKGDYVPNPLLGGAADLTTGIASVHTNGGKVIAYVEPFLIYEYSDLANTNGNAWKTRVPGGSKLDVYADTYTMMPGFQPWQDKVVDIVKRLLGYGFDGVFLDSGGWTFNYSGYTDQEKVWYNSQQWTQEFLYLVDRVRATVKDIDADDVVMTESMSGPIGRHSDGGYAADFAWLADGLDDGELRASPTREYLPQLNIFSNGGICRDLVHNCGENQDIPQISEADHLKQLREVFAAGNGLAVSYLDLQNESDILPLVAYRQTHSNSLIYGELDYQPTAASGDVIAYHFSGSGEETITAVNAGASTYTGNLVLDAADANTSWTPSTGGTATASGTSLAVTIPAGEVRMWSRSASGSGWSAGTATPRAGGPGDTMFADPFTSSPPFQYTWTSLPGGTWSSCSNKLCVSNLSSGSTILYDGLTGGNMDYSADLTITSSSGEVGLSFHLADDGSQGYDVILSKLTNTIKLSSRPYTYLDSAVFTPTQNQTYRVEVRYRTTASGDNITVLIDNTPMFTYRDLTYPSGRFGLTNYQSNATIDNVTAAQR